MGKGAVEGTHLGVQPDDLTCSLLAAQPGKEPVLPPAGAGNRVGGRWDLGWQAAGVRGEEDTSPLSGRRPFSSLLMSKVLGPVGKSQSGGRGVASGSWERQARPQLPHLQAEG